MSVPVASAPAPTLACIGCAPYTGRAHFRVRLRVRFHDDGSQLYALVQPSGLILLEAARFGMRGYCALLLLPPCGSA